MSRWLSDDLQLHKRGSLEAKCSLQQGTGHDEILLNKLCFLRCIFVDSCAAGRDVHSSEHCSAVFNPLVSNLQELRLFAHGQMKHFNANIATLRVVFCILWEMDLQSSFVAHKVLIDEVLNR